MRPGSEPSAMLADLTERSHEFRRRAEELQVQIAEISESVTSEDRRVTVTVGAGGVMHSIRVEPDGNTATANQLVTSVMRAYRKGCTRAGERSADLVERNTPGSPVADFMRAAVPPEPDEDQPDAERSR